MKLPLRKAISISLIVFFAAICIAIPATAAEFELKNAGSTAFEMPELDIQKIYMYNTTYDFYVPSRIGHEAVLYWGKKDGEDYISNISKLNGGEITNYGIDAENEDIILKKLYDWNGTEIFMDLIFGPEALLIDYPLWVGKTWIREEVNFSGTVWMGFPADVDGLAWGEGYVLYEEDVEVPAGIVHTLVYETYMNSSMTLFGSEMKWNTSQKIWLMENGFFAKRQLFHEGIFKEELVLIEPMLAMVNLKPEIIDLHSNGKLIAFIELPYDFDVANIDITTIECGGAKPVEEQVANGKLIVKFNIQDIEDLSTSNTALLTISGKLDDGTSFEGFDTIRVKQKGKINIKFNAELAC